MATVESRNVRTNTMFSAILAVLFAIKIIAINFTIKNEQIREMFELHVESVFEFSTCNSNKSVVELHVEKCTHCYNFDKHRVLF